MLVHLFLVRLYLVHLCYLVIIRRLWSTLERGPPPHTSAAAPAPLPEQYAPLLAAAAGRPKARGGLNTSEVKTALQRYGIDAIGSGLALRTLLGRALADGRILAPAAQPVTAGSGGTTATGLQHADDFADFTAAARHREHDAAGTQLQPAAVPDDVRRRPLQAHRHPPSRTGPP